MIGKTLANAINPNPSINALLPGMLLANPNPSAATTGTVTVEVVTPPLSYASGIIVRLANNVWIITMT